MRSRTIELPGCPADHRFVPWRGWVTLPRVVCVFVAFLCTTQAARADLAEIEAALRQGKGAELLPELRRLGDAGDAQAAFDLGLVYDLGRVVPENFPVAMVWYKRAAELGNATAAFNVGVMYDAGRGVAQDRAQAAIWYRRAADEGFGRADYDLGLMYLHGDGVRRDTAKAKFYFQAAEQHGVDAAREQLALLAKAEDATGEAAFAQAQAKILAVGLPSLDRDAVAELQAAAKKGNALAQYDLGLCFEQGIGLPADLVAAFVWYSRSASASPAGANASPATREAAMMAANAVQARMSVAEQQAARSQLGKPVR
jgi:TPR repeat protein